MMKLYRFLGKRGRITIPYEIRQQIGFRCNDVLSFTKLDDDSVVVRKEKICDNCNEYLDEFEGNLKKISPLKISSTVFPKKNRGTHLCIFLCCGQKNRNTKSEVNL